MAMSSDEVARLVVRITGEGEQYLKMLKQIQEETHKAHTATEKLVHKIGDFGKDFGKDLANRLLGGMGLGGLAGGLATGTMFLGEHVMDVAEKYEVANIRLNAVLEANGRQVKETSADYHRFADEIRHVSTLSELEVIGLLKTAEAYNITGEAAKRAARDAAALAEITGHSAEGMVRVTEALEKGDIKRARSYGRMLPQLRDAKDEKDFLEKYARLVEAGDKAMGQRAATVRGQWSILREDMDQWLGRAGTKLVEDLDKVTGGGLERKAEEAARRAAEERDAHRHALTDPQFGRYAVEQEIEALEKEAEQAGRTAEELKRYQAAKLGASPTDLIHLHIFQVDTAAQKADADVLSAMDKVKVQLQEIGMTTGDKAVYKFRLELERLNKEFRETGGSDARLKFLIDNAKERVKEYQALTDAMEAEQVKKGQQTNEQKMLDYEERMNNLLRQQLLTREQVNRAIEEERVKIFGVMAALRGADSFFSGANAARQFRDYFVGAGLPAREGDRGAGRGGMGADWPGRGAGEDNPAGNPWRGGAGRGGPGPEVQGVIDKVGELVDAINGGVVRFVTVDAG